MNRVLRACGGALRRFWLTPAAGDSLAFLRIGVSLIALTQLALVWPYRLSLYGNLGFVQWAVTESFGDPWLPTIGKIASALNARGVGTQAAVQLVFSVYGAGLAALALGYRTRAAAVVAWLGHAITQNSGNMSVYGVDTMLQIVLFYLMLAPCADRLSLDLRAGRTSEAPSALARVSLRTLQLHLSIIYLNTGLAKASGTQWWNGEAIWRALMQPEFAGIDATWLPHVPWIAQLMGWSVLLVEGGYALAMWIPRLRKPWLLAAIGMHLGIAFSMQLYFFSLMMIFFNLGAFGWKDGAFAPVALADERDRAEWAPALDVTLRSRTG